jgi:hypothetical protein
MNKTTHAPGTETAESTDNKQVSRPNESAAFSVEAHVKIFDPNSKEVYLEKRA